MVWHTMRRPTAATPPEPDTEISMQRPLNQLDSHDNRHQKAPPRLLAWTCRTIFYAAFLVELFPTTRFLFLAALLICVGLTCWKLFQFRRWGNEIPYIPRFFLYIFLLGVELTIENFLVWVVSATDQRRMKRLNGLQDNVEIALRAIASYSPFLKRLLTLRWVHTLQFLSASILIALSILWEQVPYSGFRMMSRFVLTLAVSRSIRVVCFMMTVLPSPKPGCYLRRFPPVPDSWSRFIRVGFQEMNGRGGCNDLIFSGHCNLWTVTPLLYHAYYQHQCCWLLWGALLQTALRTVLEHHHYSIDMFLATVMTTLIWRELHWVCPVTETVVPHTGPVSYRTARFLTGIVVCLLLTVTILILVSAA